MTALSAMSGASEAATLPTLPNAAQPALWISKQLLDLTPSVDKRSLP
jgi:hypothetical protein